MGGIAGSVSPVFREEGYVATATYDFYHAIIYNNKLYFCRKDGTVGHEPKEESDEYWFLSLDGNFSDAASLGGETALQWQTKIDSIQTTSRATLSQVGWYRVAKYSGNVNHARGAATNSCILEIKRGYSNTPNEVISLLLQSIVDSQQFKTLYSYGTKAITKVRYTYDSNFDTYLEVYYNVNANNATMFIVQSPLDSGARKWQAITPTLTEETVDGVTVTTTYDIPANASPVTDLDIAEAMEEFTYPVHKVATQEEFDALVESFHTNAQDDSYYRHFIYSSLASIVPVAGGMSVIEGCRQSANSGTQHVYRRKSSTANKYDGYKRGRTDGVWGEWGREIFEHDLVNALVRANGTETLKTSILEKALTLDNGTHEFMLGGSSYTGEDLPHILYAYGTATVHKWYGNIVVELHGHKNTATNRKAVKYYTEDNGTWSDWFIGVTTADLANYFKNTGGTVKDSIILKQENPSKYIAYYVENALRKLELGIATDGTIKLYDTTNKKTIINSPLDGVTNTFNGHSTEDLPLDGGGTVQKASALPLGIKNTSGTTCFMPIYGKDGILGFLGMNGQDTPVFMTSDQKSAKKLLHEGNYNDYALPLDGSVPMTGSELLTYNGYGRIVTTEGLMQLESKNAIGSTNNRRFLLIYNSTKEPLTRALRFSEVANGVQQTYDIHHDGNSAKVFQGASAPSDITALWVDTANKKVKTYIDGAWMAMA